MIKLKRVVDILFSSIILVLFLPFGIIISTILMITGEGQVFYIQNRVGKNGELFGMFKFATMIKDSPNIGAKDITLKNDPRVLPVGKLLRKLKLNEFPQFINVFLGDMSLVGPRPLVRNQYDVIPNGMKLKINHLLPGITGVGSVIFRDEERFLNNNQVASNDFYAKEIVPFKAKLECWYADKESILIDFKLIIITIIMVGLPNTKIYNVFLKDIPKHDIFNP